MDTGLLSRVRARLVGAPLGLVLTAILMLGVIPALVMGAYFVEGRAQSVAAARRELAGLNLLRQLQPVGQYIASPPVDEQAARQKASVAWTRLDRAMRKNQQAEKMHSKQHFNVVLGKLKLVADGRQSDPRPSYEALVARIGDQSDLFLSPDIESYYLTDIVVQKSRRLARTARELRDARQNLGENRNELEKVAAFRLRDATQDFQIAAAAAIAGNQDGTLKRSAFPRAVDATILASNDFAASTGEWSNYWKLVDANDTSWDAAAKALDHPLRARVARLQTEMWTAVGISFGILVVAIALAAGLIAAITGGLRNISQRLELMSLGDYQSPVPGTEYRNDIGVIAGALQHFVDLSGEVDAERANARIELEQTVKQVRAENEELLSQTLQQQSQVQQAERDAVGALAKQLEQQMARLLQGSRTAAHQMDREADVMAESTGHIQRDASAAAAAANEIRRSVETLAPEVRQVAEELQAYTQLLSETKDLARDAVTRVDVAKHRIAEFDDATSRAAAMLELIATIARKTNMLALNASIEAVRVGEAGQGFMVVAEEVKALAHSTRDAAHEIGMQISAMEGVKSAVSVAFSEVLDVVNVMARQSESVANGMQEQAVAINDMKDTIGSTSADLGTMVASIDGADKSAAIAIERSNEMLAASKSVSDSVNTLDESVREFLGGIQSAQRRAA